MIDDVERVAAEIVERTRREQGKPRDADPETLLRVAAVLLHHEGVAHGVG